MPEIEKIRITNRSVVERYFESHGLERLALFSDDAQKEIPFWSTDGQPRIIKGREALKENFVRNTTRYANWTWRDVTIFDTQDPHQFFVECTGGGTWSPSQDVQPRPYSNHYLMHFRFENGKIAQFREFFNPLLTAVATGGALQGIRVSEIE
ncbi:PhzA/PhzB family protein [Burkholderia ubonensis]|uniref:PhzA/PhzB family protein n=1 Tax=Burkholderia ubonensis TaxID=101571 RepID=UPI002ABE7049|nr:PhzA/PhzB family protein [Burkholderia ubonensis]